MSERREDIDWSVTTWDGSRRAQLRHALGLTLRERMEAVEGLGDVARRFQEMRARGEFKAKGQLAGLAPGELLDLMYGDEDRVPRAVIDACARHGDRMVETLGELHAPYDPEEEPPGSWWLNLHAVMILGLIPTEAAGLLAVRMMRLAAEMGDDHLEDWLAGYWPDFLANKPETVIEAAREVAADRSLGWYVRANALEPVVAAAERRGPQALDQELDRLAVVAADETEDGEVRLSCAQLLLDFPRARHRALLDDLASQQEDSGVSFRADDVEKAYTEGDSPQWRWHNDPWKFYRPEKIAERQERWAKEAAQEPRARAAPKVGRNDPCPCGSGKKYKKCCLGGPKQ